MRGAHNEPCTSIGLDVHARWVQLSHSTRSRRRGSVTQKFGYSPRRWQDGFFEHSPKAVYESGVTRFHLVRELREMGVDCIVGAVSRCSLPASDRRKKNDRNDAEFLARQLMAHQHRGGGVRARRRDRGARSLSRALEGTSQRPYRAKAPLHLLIPVGLYLERV